MQIDSRLIYALLGSFITLLLIFVFKLVFLSDELIPSTVLADETLCEEQEKQYSYADTQKPPTEKTVAEKRTQAAVIETPKADKVKKVCDEQCLEASISELISGKNLGDDEGGISFSSERANQIAQHLANDPSKLAEVEATLSSLRGQDARDTILYVFSRLPDEQIQQAAGKLSSSQNPRDRVDSLSLLSSVVGSNIDVQNEIKQIVSNENDPDILLKAIKVSHSLNPDVVDSTVQSRLSNLINSNDDEQIRSAALITKTNITRGDVSLQTDIKTALNSPSTRFTEAGLQALDNVLSRQKRDSSQGSWKSNPQLRTNVERIANDPNADPATRVEALNLIRRHYHNR